MSLASSRRGVVAWRLAMKMKMKIWRATPPPVSVPAARVKPKVVGKGQNPRPHLLARLRRRGLRATLSPPQGKRRKVSGEHNYLHKNLINLSPPFLIPLLRP